MSTDGCRNTLSAPVKHLSGAAMASNPAIMIAPGIVQLALTLLLTPPLGAAGAAIAAAAGAATGSALLAIIGQRLVALPLPLGQLARIAIASALMAATVLALPPSNTIIGLALTVTAGATAYGAAAIALDIMTIRTRAAAFAQAAISRFQLLIAERTNVRS